jgi:dolichol-phosphate mannosyltransferase
VGVITADLQDPPELFAEMLAHWERGIKAVFAVRSDRKESASKRLFANTYYLLLRRFAIANYPSGGFDFLLIDRRVADEVNAIREKNTNLMSLIFWLGHQYVTIPYVRSAQKASESRWTLAKKIKLFVDSFVAFSYVPIRFLSAVGLLVATAAFIYGAAVLWVWLRFGVEIKGWTPIVLMVAFTAGVQMTMLGVLGEYLWRALDEIRRRPPYVIEDVYQ